MLWVEPAAWRKHKGWWSEAEPQDRWGTKKKLAKRVTPNMKPLLLSCSKKV